MALFGTGAVALTAFSSEADTGSRQANASKRKDNGFRLQSEPGGAIRKSN